MKLRQKFRNALLLGLMSVSQALPTNAAEFYWDINGNLLGASNTGNATQNWDGALQHFNDTADGLGLLSATVGATDTVVFSAGSNATQASTITVTGTQTIGGLKFEEGSLLLSGPGTLLLGQNSSFDVASLLTSTVNTVVDDGGSGFDLTKTGAGTLVLGGVNTYSGRTILNAGTLSISSDANLGDVPGAAVANSITFSGGSTLLTTSSFTLDSNRGITINSGVTGNFQTASGTTLTYGGVVTGAAGTTFRKSGAGTLDLQGNSTASFLGALNVDGGTLSLSGSGQMAGTSGVTIGNRGTLTLDNTATNLGNRTAGTLTSRGGTINFTHGGAAATNYSETLGALALNAGALTINGSQAAVGQTSIVTLPSITRVAGGTLFFNGAGAGVDARNELRLTSIAGIPASGVIIPWAVVNDGTGVSFAQNTGAGTTLRRFAGAVNTGLVSTWVAASNARPAADDTLNNAARSVNTITLDAGIDLLGTTLSADRIITMSGAGGGAFLQTGGNSTITNNGTSSYQFAFGGNEALFHVLGSLDIGTGSTADTNLTGTAGLTKTGAGVLTIRGNSTITGTYRVNEGVLDGRSAGSFGAAQPMELNGGTLRLVNSTSTTFTPTITVNADSGVSITRGAAGGAVTHTVGTLSIGGGRTLSVAQGANFDLNSNYGLTTGALTLTSGGATFNVGNGSGTGIGTMTVGAITGAFGITKTGAGDLVTNNTLAGYTAPVDIQAGSVGWSNATLTVTESQIFSGAGGIVRNTGGGTTNLTGANTFTGGVRVNGGTLGFSTVSNNGGSASNLGQGTDGITLNGGTLNFIGDTSQSTNRALNLTASSTLGINGTSGAVMTYTGGLTGAGTTNDLTASGTGTMTISGSPFVVPDDFTVTGSSMVLNLNSAGVLTFGASADATLQIQAGGTVNLGVSDAVNTTAGVFDRLFVGQGGAAGTSTFAMGAFNQTTDRLDIGVQAVGLIGNVTGTGVLTANNAINLGRGSITADLAGAGAIIKLGLGDVTLSGDNTGLTGITAARVDAGNLILDYTTENNDKLRALTDLDMRGGKLTITGNTLATGQTVSALTLASGGANAIDVNAGAGGAVLNLNAITRGALANDGTIRFELPAGTQSAANGITTDSLNNNTSANGILGGWATVDTGSGIFFARNTTNALDGNIGAATATLQDNVALWVAGDNVSDDSAGYSGTLALPSGLGINSLRFNANAASAVTVNAGGTLNIATGGVLMTSAAATGAHTISGGTLTSGIGELIFTNDSVEGLTVSSRITGASGVTKAGTGTLTLSGANNNYTGPTDIQAGVVIASGGNAIGNNSAVTLADDQASTLQITGNETIGSLAGGNATTGLLVGVVDIGSNTLTLRAGGAYLGTLTGSGNLVRNNTLSAAVNANWTGVSGTGFTGTVTVDGGLFQLSGNGNLGNASAITVNKGGSFLFDNNGATRSGTRVLDSTPITLNSADGAFATETIVRGLGIRTDQNAQTSETIGNLNFASGANYLFGNASGTTGIAAINANNFLRTNNATVDARGRAMGSTTGDRNLFRITTPANETAFLATLVGGGGAAGTQNISIVPWGIGETLTANLADTNMGNSLITYVSGQGFRALDFATEYDTIALAAATDNARASLATTNLTGLVGTTVNALVLHNADTAASTRLVTGTGAGQALAVTSGALLFTRDTGAAGNYGITLGGFDSGITTTSPEYVIHVVNPDSASTTKTLTATISSNLNSAADITKSGRGILILSGAGNTAGGGATNKTTINEGTLQIGDLDNIGGNTGGLVFAGGTLRVTAGFADVVFDRTVNVLNGGGTIDLGLVTAGQTWVNGIDDATPNSSDRLDLFTRSSATGNIGQLTIQGDSTYTGTVVVRNSGINSGLVNGVVLNGTTNAAINGNLEIGNLVNVDNNNDAVVALGASEQIVDNATITFRGATGENAYFKLLGFNETVAGIIDTTGNGVIANRETEALIGSSTLTLNSSDDFSYNGFLRDQSDGLAGTDKLILIKQGTGTQTLSGVQIRHSGQTTISAGALTLTDVTNWQSAITNNATLNLNQTTGSRTHLQVIDGPGALNKLGAGTVVLSGLNTYIGATSVTGGVLNFTSTLNGSTELSATGIGSNLTLSGGLTSPGSITSVVVGGGGNSINFLDGFGTPITGLTTLNLGGGAGIAILGLELGTTSDTLTTSTAATIANIIQFNLSGVSGISGGTPYDLLVAPSGLGTLSNYILGSQPGGFAVGSLSMVSDSIVRYTTGAAIVGDLFWNNTQLNGSWTFNTGVTNWGNDLAGTEAGFTPGPGTTVRFGTTLVAGPAIATTLNGNVSVNDLLFTANPSGVTSVSIAPGTPSTSTLTIAPSSATTGIDVADNAGAVTISARVGLGANQTWSVAGTGANGSSLTVSGVVSGSGTLAKTGLGNLTLGGVNTFSNGLTIKEGAVIAITSNQSLGGTGTGTVTLGDTSGTAAASLLIGTTALTYANPIVLATNPTVGTLAIGNANDVAAVTFSGGVTGSNNLTIANNGTAARTVTLSTATINNVGTVTNTGTSTGATTISSVIGTNVTEVIQNSTTSSLTLSGVNTLYNNGITVQAGTLTAGAVTVDSLGASTNLITLGDSVGSAPATLTLGNAALTYAQPLTTVAGGTGALTLRTPNNTTFSGPITLAGGRDLVVSKSGTTGFFDLTGGVTGTGNIVIDNLATTTATMAFTTNAVNMTGTISNIGTAAGNGTTTISADIGANVTGVTQNSVSTGLTLSGENSFASNLTLTAGTLNLNNDNAWGTSAGSFIITSGVLNNSSTGAIIMATNKPVSIGGNFAFTGTQNLDLATGAVTLGGAAGNRTITANGGILAMNGIISDGTATGITKAGAGALTLGGANAFTGGVILSAGTLNINNATALGTVAGTFKIDGGTINNTSIAAINMTADNPLNIAGNFAFTGTQNLNLGAGAVTLNGAAGNRTITANAGILTLGGALSDGTATGLTKAGAGTLALSNANLYTGGTSVTGGMLLLNNAAALPGGIAATGGASGLTLNGGVVGLGNGPFNRALGVGVDQVQFTGSGGFAAVGGDRIVDLGGSSAGVTWNTGSFVPTGSTLILSHVSADSTVDFKNPIDLAAAVRTVQVDNGSATVDAILSGAITGVGGALTKTGAGTLALSGLSATAANNYTGLTTLSAGTLVLNTNDASLTGGLTLGTAAALPPVALDLDGVSATFGGALTMNINNATASTITVDAGEILTVNNNVQIGATNPGSTTAVTNLAIGGGGAFNVATAAAGTFIVGGSTNGTNVSNTTLDLTDLTSTTINTSTTGTIRVNNLNGTNLPGSEATLLLPTPVVIDTVATATLTAGTIAVGNSSMFNSQPGQINSIVLGTGLTTLNADTINVGTGSRDIGQIIFDGVDGDVIIRAADGTSRATLIAIGTGGATTGTTEPTTNNLVDFSTHDANILVTTLNVGNQARIGNLTSEFKFGADDASLVSNLDATNVNIGFRTGTATATSTLTNRVNLSGGAVTFGNVGATGTGVIIGSSTYTGAGAASTVGELNISGGTVTIHNGSGGFAVRIGNNTSANGGTVTASMNLTGGTTTLGGHIIKGTATGVVSSTLTLNGAGAILDMGGNNITSLDSITYTAGTLKNLGVVNTGMTLAGAALESRVFDQDPLFLLGDIQGAITAPAGVGITKQGAGILTLSGANTYDGVTTISGGLLGLNNATALPGGIGVSGGTSGLTLNGGVLGFGFSNFDRALGTGADQVQFTGSGGFAAFGTNRDVNLGGLATGVTWNSGSFVPTGSSLILGNANSANTVTFVNPIDFNGATRSIEVANGSAATDAVLSGVLSGTGGGGLTKSGAGTLTLSGTNSYTGPTTVNGGVLSISSDANLGAAPVSPTPGNIVLNGGTLRNTAAITIDENRGMTLGASGGTINNAVNSTTTYNGDIDGVGSLTVSHSPSTTGDLSLGGDNTYSGATIIDNGHLSVNNITVGAASSIGSSSDAAANLVLKNDAILHFQGGGSPSTTTRLFTLGTGDNEIRSSGAGGITFSNTGSIATVDSGIRTLSLNAATASATNTLASVIGDGAGGATSVHKHGSGTWVLSGNNTYTGATDVNAGTLQIDGSTASGSTVTVQNGATLAGTGIVNGSVQFTSGSVHRPGNSPGIQTLAGAVDYASGSEFVWDLTDNLVSQGMSPIFDEVKGGGTGTLNIASGVNSKLKFGGSVDFANSFWGSDKVWTVFSGFTSVIGSLNTPSLENLSPVTGVPNGTFAWVNTGSGNVTLNYTAVPEPTSLVFGVGLGVAGLIAARRRQKSKATAEPKVG